jgi:hypothetical protein
MPGGSDHQGGALLETACIFHACTTINEQTPTQTIKEEKQEAEETHFLELLHWHTPTKFSLSALHTMNITALLFKAAFICQNVLDATARIISLSHTLNLPFQCRKPSVAPYFRQNPDFQPPFSA